MSGTPFTTGQLGKLQTILVTAVTTASPKVAEKFGDPKAVLGALKNKTEVLAGYLEDLVAEAIRRMVAFIRHPQRSVRISEHRDFDAYYQSRAGLYVSDSFRRLVVAKAKPVEVGTVFEINEDELGKNMADKQIEDGLPKRRLFDESAVSAIAAELIESGQLDKCWYLLYISSCVVLVRWYGGYAPWNVDAWERDDIEWRAGFRVLSPAN